MSVDTNGTVKVIGEVGVSHSFGPVEVGVFRSYEKVLAGYCEDAILLVERPVDGRPMVTAYRLKSDQSISWATCGNQSSTWDPTQNALYVKLGRGAKIALIGGDKPPKRPKCVVATKPKPNPPAGKPTTAQSTPPTTPSAGQPTPATPPSPEPSLVPDGSATVSTAPRASL